MGDLTILLKKLWDQKGQDSIPYAVGYVNFSSPGIQRQTHGVDQTAERASNHGKRSHVSVICNVPYAYETQNRVQPRIVRDIFHAGFEGHAVVQILMKVIRSREKNLAPIKFHLPGLIGDAGLRSCDSGAGRDIAIIGAIKNQN